MSIKTTLGRRRGISTKASLPVVQAQTQRQSGEESIHSERVWRTESLSSTMATEIIALPLHAQSDCELRQVFLECFLYCGGTGWNSTMRLALRQQRKCLIVRTDPRRSRVSTGLEKSAIYGGHSGHFDLPRVPQKGLPLDTALAATARPQKFFADFAVLSRMHGCWMTGPLGR